MYRHNSQNIQAMDESVVSTRRVYRAVSYIYKQDIPILGGKTPLSCAFDSHLRVVKIFYDSRN